MDFLVQQNFPTDVSLLCSEIKYKNKTILFKLISCIILPLLSIYEKV